MVFLPPWSIVHARVYKAQLPYFSERFRCITFDPRGNGKSDQPERGRRLLAGQLHRRRARGDGCHRCRQGHPGRPVARRDARVHAGGAPSRAREGGGAGRHGGDRRPGLSVHGAEALHGQARAVRGLGQVQPRLLARALSRLRRALRAQHLLRCRTRPSRSRTASNGPATPRGQCWPRRWRRARSRRRSMSARPCTARSNAPC